LNPFLRQLKFPQWVLCKTIIFVRIVYNSLTLTRLKARVILPPQGVGVWHLSGW